VAYATAAIASALARVLLGQDDVRRPHPACGTLLLVGEMIVPMDRFDVAHRISRKQDRLLDSLRDRRAFEAAGPPGTADTFEALIGETYALVVTFRRSGQPVPTPMWFGLHTGRVYVESLADAGKVKRLQHDRHVRVAPCTVRGKPLATMAITVAGRPREIRSRNDPGALLRRSWPPKAWQRGDPAGRRPCPPRSPPSRSRMPR
jgi:PPOX class probable F420-dependent enzyme